MNERMAIGSEGYVSIQSRLYVYGDVTTLESSLSNFPRLQFNSTHDGGLMVARFGSIKILPLLLITTGSEKYRGGARMMLMRRLEFFNIQWDGF
jgi:hypothetical protein